MTTLRPSCSIEDCAEPSRTRGYCKKHYARWRRHGSALYGTPLNRFMRNIYVEHGVECWMWTGLKDVGGYGRMRAEGGKQVKAHRFAYEHFVGPVPEGLVLDHFFCNQRACVNPRHVRPVTPRENALRSDSPPARNAAKETCPQGHAYDEANTGRYGAGRYCRACKRDKKRASDAAKRMAVAS